MPQLQRYFRVRTVLSFVLCIYTLYLAPNINTIFLTTKYNLHFPFYACIVTDYSPYRTRRPSYSIYVILDFLSITLTPCAL